MWGIGLFESLFPIVFLLFFGVERLDFCHIVA